MDVSTAEFYDAVKEIAQGNTTNAAVNAKRVSDYVEQTKQTNYTTLEDVFLTKDDKVDLMRYIDSKIERQTRLLIAVIGIGFTIMIALIGFMYNAINMIQR